MHDFWPSAAGDAGYTISVMAQNSIIVVLWPKSINAINANDIFRGRMHGGVRPSGGGPVRGGANIAHFINCICSFDKQ